MRSTTISASDATVTNGLIGMNSIDFLCLMLRRSFAASCVVRGLRRYRQHARHHAIVKKHRLRYYVSRDKGQNEARARALLRRAEAATSWIPTPLYPTGGAAGPLLLYLLIRALQELPVRRVLELGAGQTTRLLNAWACYAGGDVVTFEHDQRWATKMASEVDPTRLSILHLPLEDHPAPIGFVQWYAEPPIGSLPQEGFDIVVVDGPVGTKRLSRYGIVNHIPGWVGRDWVIIWDDLERLSDLQSFALLIERLRSMNIEHGHLLLDGDRTIGLVYTPEFSDLQYMW